MTSLVREKKRVRYYEIDSVVEFEEDLTHEFKGHVNLTNDELPPWAFIHGTDKRSRKAIDRNINGILNTGQGGTIYMGIVDSGHVKGLVMTQYNKDHFVAAVDDVMSRYQPPVDKSQYKVRFVKAVDMSHCSDKELQQILRFDSTSTVDPETRRRQHRIRAQVYCWCDKDKVAQLNCGTVPPKYVIELVIKPWEHSQTSHLDSSSRLKLHPIYQDDEGKCYIRRNASNVPLEMDQIYSMGRQDAARYYQQEMKRVKQEIAELEQRKLEREMAAVTVATSCDSVTTETAAKVASVTMATGEESVSGDSSSPGR